MLSYARSEVSNLPLTYMISRDSVSMSMSLLRPSSHTEPTIIAVLRAQHFTLVDVS